MFTRGTLKLAKADFCPPNVVNFQNVSFGIRFMTLQHLGWNAHFDHHFEIHRPQGLLPARVARATGIDYCLFHSGGDLSAVLAGRLRHRSCGPEELPAVGDWVLADPPGADGLSVIRAVLPRTSTLVRRASGHRKGLNEGIGRAQVLAANVDLVFIVSGLDGDYNPRRIERYLTLVHDSGAQPVVVLNKADLCPEASSRRAQIEELSFGTPVHLVSAKGGEGLEAVSSYLQEGRTLVLVGSSGAGKSTLVNRLLGEDRQRVSEVSASVGKGRHTTTHRELLLTPSGAVIIDTPGLRELHLMGEEESLEGAFPDVEQLARTCRFRNCTHDAEPGCAVREALSDGTLDAGRFDSYRKQRQELKTPPRQNTSPARRRGKK